MDLLGMALYTIASLGSGLAPSFPWLLGSRALQGIGIDADAASNNGDHRPHLLARTTRPGLWDLWALVNGGRTHALGFRP